MGRRGGAQARNRGTSARTQCGGERLLMPIHPLVTRMGHEGESRVSFAEVIGGSADDSEAAITQSMINRDGERERPSRLLHLCHCLSLRQMAIAGPDIKGSRFMW